MSARPSLLAACLCLPLLAAGCWRGDPQRIELRRQVDELQQQIDECREAHAACQETCQRLQRELAQARGLSEADLEHIFYPARIEILTLTGGEDYDGQPGDDGVTVLLRPIDRDGDAVKVAGDVEIKLYDLAEPSGRELLGEYHFTADEVGRYWFGKLATYHYVFKCPWQAGRVPAHAEITVRVTFTDYLTRRVLSAQRVCRVSPPAQGQ